MECQITTANRGKETGDFLHNHELHIYNHESHESHEFNLGTKRVDGYTKDIQ